MALPKYTALTEVPLPQYLPRFLGDRTASWPGLRLTWFPRTILIMITPRHAVW